MVLQHLLSDVIAKIFYNNSHNYFLKCLYRFHLANMESSQYLQIASTILQILFNTWNGGSIPGVVYKANINKGIHGTALDTHICDLNNIYGNPFKSGKWILPGM